MQAIVRAVACFSLVIVFCCVSPAAIVEFDYNRIGDDLFRIHYDIKGIDFLQYQELEIRFDPVVYRVVENPAVPAGFDALLFQPGDPLGTEGRFSVMALLNHPALTGGFSVDVRTMGSHRPGIQAFAVNQLDASGSILTTVVEGHTTWATPEPATSVLTGAVLVLAVVLSRFCQRRRRTG